MRSKLFAVVTVVAIAAMCLVVVSPALGKPGEPHNPYRGTFTGALNGEIVFTFVDADLKRFNGNGWLEFAPEDGDVVSYGDYLGEWNRHLYEVSPRSGNCAMGREKKGDRYSFWFKMGNYPHFDGAIDMVPLYSEGYSGELTDHGDETYTMTFTDAVFYLMKIYPKENPHGKKAGAEHKEVWRGTLTFTIELVPE